MDINYVPIILLGFFANMNIFKKIFIIFLAVYDISATFRYIYIFLYIDKTGCIMIIIFPEIIFHYLM